MRRRQGSDDGRSPRPRHGTGMTDETLMAAFKQGDASAFSALVNRYEKPLWNFMRRYAHDRAIAEDLTQEVLLRVLRNAPDWEPAAKFSTWLYTIARNICIDYSRRMVHRTTTSLDGVRTGDGESSKATARIERVVGPDRGGEAAALGKEAATRIEAAIATLPDEQREVFLMREVMDLPFAEIAEVTGVPLPTVKSRMRYALERLRQALSDLRESPPEPSVTAGSAQPIEVP
jgi:RNA polymerase sigma-70 factor (ECF subfamily)